MPWPMIHFAISQRLYDGRTSPEFLLGSIAPDAVLVRKNDEEAKAKSHLRSVMGERPSWDGLRQFYYSCTEAVASAEFKLFVQGYLSHIIADQLWSRYKKSVGGTDRAMRDILWREENQVDFQLNRSAPWRDTVKQQVLTSPLYELPDLYTLDELDRWRRQLFIWLQEPSNEPHIVNQFITESGVKRFIGEAVLEIHDWMDDLISPPTSR